MKALQKGIKVLKEEGIIIFLKKFLRYFQNRIEIFIYPLYFLKIKKFRHKNLHQLVDFVFNCSLIKPSQIKEEILELLKILEKKKPKIILEIGTANGGTLFLFSRIAPKNATIISIDLPQGKFGGGYPKWKTLLYKSFTKDNQKIYLLREDSHQLSTLEKVKDILKGQKIDFLFIDGDHSYEGVKKDFEMYSNLVEGGVIALHDIVHHPYIPDCQVEKLWKEIKQKYKTKEIIFSSNQTWAGIGVIYT